MYIVRYVSGDVARSAIGTGGWGAAAAAGWPVPGTACIMISVAIGAVAKSGSTVLVKNDMTVTSVIGRGY